MVTVRGLLRRPGYRAAVIASGSQAGEVAQFTTLGQPLVGQHTDCCCRHTTYDAFLREIAVTVVSDGTCVFEPVDPASTQDRQQRALQYLQYYYQARIADADTVLAQG